MGRSNGHRAYHCPFCDERHYRTNWMIRRGVVAVHPGDAGEMRLVAKDTAQIACARRHGWRVVEVTDG